MTAVVEQTPELPQMDLKSAASPKLEGEALEKALKQQFDFYFSQENLDKDLYLQSQMNAQNFVPVEVIMNFRKVLSLTTDRAVVIKAMSECKNLVLDEQRTMVRPNKRGRTTLILRDIPASVPVEDIKAIFVNTQHCPQPIKIHSDVGDTWFVQFGTEAECQDAMLAVQGTSFQGAPLRCGVKSEHVLRAFAPVNRPPAVFPEFEYAEFPEYYPGYNPYLVGPYAQWQGPFDPSQDSRKPRTQSRSGKPRDKRNEAPYGAKVKRKGKEGQEAPRKEPPPEIKLGLDNFPALPSPVKKSDSVQSAQKVIKYDRETLAAIVRGVAKTAYAIPIPPDGDNAAVLAAAPRPESQLLEPMPVMYPASPSPELAAQPHHSSAVPVLDLNLPFPEYAEVPDDDPEEPKEPKEPVVVTAGPYATKKGKSRRKSLEDTKAPKEEKATEVTSASTSASGTSAVKATAKAPSGKPAQTKQTYADLLKKKT